ncbi:MAG: hypothetical protein QXG65_01525 [Thermoplasmata archaeon]
MGARIRLGLLVALLLVGASFLAGSHPAGGSAAGPAPAAVGHPAGAASAPLTGTVHGPTLLRLNASQPFVINATGGPAFAPNGTLVGNLTYHATIFGANTSGLSVNPNFGGLTGTSNYTFLVNVGPVPQTVTLIVEFSSVYQSQNQSINITTTLYVVRPYTVSGEVVAGTQTVLPFSIAVDLDGTPVGAIAIPTLLPHEGYNFTFDYLTRGLPPGEHTFTLSLSVPNGQVRFANGATSFSESFYVTGPPPDYTLYYLLGVGAFVGVILISLILVGARRRAGGR